MPPPRYRSLFFLALLLAMLLAGARALAQTGSPLMLRSEASGQIFRLNPPMFGTFEADEPHRVEVSRTYANLWARDKRFVIDAEIVDDRAHVTAFPLPWLRIGGGFASRRFAQTATDQIAISFHDFFRIGQDGRLEAGKHHTIYKIPDYSLEYSEFDIDRPISRQFNGDVSVPLFSEAAKPWVLSATLMASYETAQGSPYFANALDRGLQLNARYPWRYGAAYAALTQLAFDSSRSVDVATVHQQFGWAAGLVQSIYPDHEALAQVMVYQPVFRQLGQLSRNSYEAQIGYRVKIERVFIEAALIENFFWLYNSPDWGMSLGVRAMIGSQ